MVETLHAGKGGEESVPPTWFKLNLLNSRLTVPFSISQASPPDFHSSFCRLYLLCHLLVYHAG